MKANHKFYLIILTATVLSLISLHSESLLLEKISAGGSVVIIVIGSLYLTFKEPEFADNLVSFLNENKKRETVFYCLMILLFGILYLLSRNVVYLVVAGLFAGMRLVKDNNIVLSIVFVTLSFFLLGVTYLQDKTYLTKALGVLSLLFATVTSIVGYKFIKQN